MNIYKANFSCSCIKNGDVINYLWVLRTHRIILVEDIESSLQKISIHPAFHEKIADDLYQLFGGHQVIVARHREIEIETIRGIP